MKFMPCSRIFKKFNFICAVLLIIFTSTSVMHCSVKYIHYKAGTVTSHEGKDFQIKISSKSDVKPGEKYKVYYFRHIPFSLHGESFDNIERIYAGEIQVTDIINERAAKAVLVEGNIKKGYIVEIE